MIRMKSNLRFRALPFVLMACIAVFSFGCFNKTGPSDKEFSQIFMDDIWSEEIDTQGFKIGKVDLQSFETGANEVEVSFSLEIVTTEDFYGFPEDMKDYLDPDLVEELNNSKQAIRFFSDKLMNADLPPDASREVSDEYSKILRHRSKNEIDLLEKFAKKKDSFFVYGELVLKQRGERWKIESINEVDVDEVPDWVEDAEPESAITDDWVDIASKKAPTILKKNVEESKQALAKLNDKLDTAQKQVAESRRQEEEVRAQRLKSFIGVLRENSVFDGIVIEQQSLQSRKVRMNVLSLDDSGFAKLEFTDPTVPDASRSFNARVEESPDDGGLRFRAVSNEYQRGQGLFFDYRRPIEFLFNVSDDSLSAADNVFDLKLEPLSAEVIEAEAKEREAYYQSVLDAVQPGLVYRGLLRDANGANIRNLESPVVEVILSFKRVEQSGRMVEAVMALAKNPNVYRPLNGSILSNAFNTGEAPIALRPSGEGTHRSTSIFSRYSFELKLSPENAGQGLSGAMLGDSYGANKKVTVSMNLSDGDGESASQPGNDSNSNPQSPTAHSGSTTSGGTSASTNNPSANNTTQSSAPATAAPATRGLYIRDGESWTPLVSTTDFSVKNANVLGDVTEVLGLFSKKKAAPAKEKLLIIKTPPKRFTQLEANQTLAYVGNGTRPIFHRLDLNTEDKQLEAKLVHDAHRSRQSSGDIYTVSEDLKVPVSSRQRGTYREIEAIVPPKPGWYMFGFDDHKKDPKKYLIKIK